MKSSSLSNAAFAVAAPVGGARHIHTYPNSHINKCPTAAPVPLRRSSFSHNNKTAASSRPRPRPRRQFLPPVHASAVVDNTDPKSPASSSDSPSPSSSSSSSSPGNPPIPNANASVNADTDAETDADVDANPNGASSSSSILTPPSTSSSTSSDSSTIPAHVSNGSPTSSTTTPSSSSSSLSSTVNSSPNSLSASTSDSASSSSSSSDDINRNILAIALPALGTLALDPLVALADMACVGYLGASALGGVGIGNNVFNISFTCFNFLGLATTPAIARAFARSDRDEASRLIAQALWVALISGTTAMCVLSMCTGPILRFFGANALILPHAMQYLRARIVAAPFFLTAMVGNGTFRGFQDTRTPLFVGLFANTLNLILYPTLIFAFGLGTRGAGIAMATGQICAGLTLLVLLIRTKKLQLQHLWKVPRPQDLVPLLRTGAVLSVRTLSIYSTIAYATATAALMGTVQVAAFEIGRQIFALFARLLDAISVAAQALVALALGRNDYSRARRVANRILWMSFSMGCGFVALLMLVVNTAPSVFTGNPAVRAAVTQTFPFMAVIQPVNGLVFVFDGVFTAARKFTILSSAIFVAACCASSFLYGVRMWNLPLNYVWIGLNVMMILRAMALGIIYLSKWSPVPATQPAGGGDSADGEKVMKSADVPVAEEEKNVKGD